MKIKRLAKPPKRVLWGTGPSPQGDLLVGLTEQRQVCRATVLRGRDPVDVVSEWHTDWKTTSFVLGDVPKDYMALPLAMVGTELQVKAWREIMRIPAGEVASYGEVARRIGMPGRARAVGTACALNPLAVIVPATASLPRTGSAATAPTALI